MEKEILLSFVLPVYNVEKYLDECVDSILSQITDECEIILVDDGSTDSSGAICEMYAEKDARIKLVKKENGGLSSARNSGLGVATGRYVTFVDSDDMIFDGCLSHILSWSKENSTDVCFLRATKFYPDSQRKDMGECIVRERLFSQKKEDAVYHLASLPKYPGSAWAKLFRREFLTENDLHFPFDRRYSEDLGFMRDCILLAENFDYIDEPFYLYRQNREGSITNKITFRNFSDLFIFIEESVAKLTSDKKAHDRVCEYMMSFVAYEYTILLYHYNMLPDEDKKQALVKLKEYKWVLKYSISTRGRAISAVSKILSIRFIAVLIKMYRKATDI